MLSERVHRARREAERGLDCAGPHAASPRAACRHLSRAYGSAVPLPHSDSSCQTSCSCSCRRTARRDEDGRARSLGVDMCEFQRHMGLITRANLQSACMDKRAPSLPARHPVGRAGVAGCCSSWSAKSEASCACRGDRTPQARPRDGLRGAPRAAWATRTSWAALSNVNLHVLLSCASARSNGAGDTDER